ncbi:hypothetical protein AAFF_G00145680 [Aldrovandia affinis]|uniref:Uncharacterized protein n=1 Tax=Aldrovandia affinis TaxID=143900 RepID=A0AAD7WWM3_9TELE|nr:hypothetical protein AAFF_G00145680 [Aldrovandia affinis]
MVFSVSCDATWTKEQSLHGEEQSRDEAVQVVVAGLPTRRRHCYCRVIVKTQVPMQAGDQEVETGEEETGDSIAQHEDKRKQRHWSPTKEVKISKRRLGHTALLNPTLSVIGDVAELLSGLGEGLGALVLVLEKLAVHLGISLQLERGQAAARRRAARSPNVGHAQGV